jgi:hypothetical protein
MNVWNASRDGPGKKNNFSCLRSEGIGESQQLESELPLFSDDKISP